ncbi:MAG: RDD family protein [Acidimicrobiales bacterium]
MTAPRYADLVTRIVTYLIDFVVLVVVLIPFGVVDSLLGDTSVVVLLGIIASVAYLHVLHPVWNGTTIGKQVMSQVLVDEESLRPLPPQPATVRAMMALLSPFLTCGLINIVNFILLLSDPRRQMVHDKAGRAVVIPAAEAAPDVSREWGQWRWF